MTLRPDIDINGINEALNNKADIDLNNTQLQDGCVKLLFGGNNTWSTGANLVLSESWKNFDLINIIFCITE